MSAKIILVFCAQALLTQYSMSQCIGAGLGSLGLAGAYDGFAGPYARVGSAMAYDGLAGSWGYDGLNGYGRGIGCGIAPAMDFTPTSGGGLPVTSASAIAPVGLSVVSENVYEGILAAAGELPFVGTVAVEGILPTAGAGAINHACGNGVNAMVSETTAFAPGFAGAYGTGFGNAGAYGAGLGYDGAFGAGLGYNGAFGAGLGYNGAFGAGLGYGGAFGAGLGYADAIAPGLGGAGWAGRGCGCAI